jgi:hypothetical protein
MLHMPNFDPDEDNKVQECTTKKLDNAIEQLAIAIQRLADTKKDRTLFNNFWLNEIKSIDDTIRLQMNINILLVAAYSTIIATNYDKILNIISIYEDIAIKYVNYYEFFYTVFIITPLLYWVMSMRISSSDNHIIPSQNAEPLLDDGKASDYFLYIYNRKNDISWYSYLMLVYGLIYVICILFLSSTLDNIVIARNYKAIIFYAAISIGFLWCPITITRYKKYMKHNEDF